MTITVGVPAATKAANTPVLASLDNKIQFTTSPKGAAVTECDVESEKDVIAVTIREARQALVADTQAVRRHVDVIPAAGATTGDAATISIEACGDMSRFNDEMVTFSFVGDVADGHAGGLGQHRQWW